jgi:hypothetical protein
VVSLGSVFCVRRELGRTTFTGAGQGSARLRWPAPALLVYLKAYDTISNARGSIARYICFYISKRPDPSLDWQSPDHAYFTRLPQIVAAWSQQRLHLSRAKCCSHKSSRLRQTCPLLMLGLSCLPPPLSTMNAETTQTAPDMTPAPTSGPALPSFESCMATASAGTKSGIDALGALSAPLQQSCPELALILRSSAVRTSVETYARQDAEAIRQQATLMQEATRANVCLMAAGVTSGLVLAVAAELPDDLGFGIHLGKSNITLGLGIVTLALGAAGSFFGYLARDQGRISRWQARRGEAEIARLDVFKTIADNAAEAGLAVALHGLALIVSHLLDNQRNWLAGHALRHRESSETTSRWGALASALAFIGGSGAIIASRVEHSI